MRTRSATGMAETQYACPPIRDAGKSFTANGLIYCESSRPGSQPPTQTTLDMIVNEPTRRLLFQSAAPGKPLLFADMTYARCGHR
jgi:hypothetical protein